MREGDNPLIIDLTSYSIAIQAAVIGGLVFGLLLLVDATGLIFNGRLVFYVVYPFFAVYVTIQNYRESRRYWGKQRDLFGGRD